MASKITKKDVEYIASLARINLRSSDLPKYEKELSAILDFVSQLSKAKTDSVEPLSSVSGLENITREDAITSKPDMKNLLANAPDKENDSFKVNKVIDKGPSS